MVNERVMPGIKLKRFVIIIAIASCLVNCTFQVKAGVISPESRTLWHTPRFIYLAPVDPKIEMMVSDRAISTAISKFQFIMGIDVSRKMTDESGRLVNLPRCGVKDILEPEGSRRSKRYNLQTRILRRGAVLIGCCQLTITKSIDSELQNPDTGSRWPSKNLTYKIKSYPGNLEKTAVDKEIARAFAVWSEYTDLSFSPGSGEVHINIRFERQDHGDENPFDGPGGVLAHAFYPEEGGDVHFDDEEVWTIDSRHGLDLFYVAVHEFGHSLGLGHSQVESALMTPNYKRHDAHSVLHEDDIAGIQALYGPKTRRGVPDICEDPQIDTMFNFEGHVYAFKGKYYWKTTANEIANEHPKLITDKWIELPGDINAAFTYTNGKIYFFKGSQYWRYCGAEMDGDYPRAISEGFPGIPDNIDAVWTSHGKVYFFKGNEYWKFDPAQRPSVKSNYPKLISNWKGLSADLDAALTYKHFNFSFCVI